MINYTELVIGSQADPDTEKRIRLDHGRYSLGRGLDCDLVLFDDAINDRHLYINVEAGGVTVAPLEGALVYTSDADKRETGEKAPLVAETDFPIGNNGVLELNTGTNLLFQFVYDKTEENALEEALEPEEEGGGEGADPVPDATQSARPAYSLFMRRKTNSGAIKSISFIKLLNTSGLMSFSVILVVFLAFISAFSPLQSLNHPSEYEDKTMKIPVSYRPQNTVRDIESLFHDKGLTNLSVEMKDNHILATLFIKNDQQEALSSISSEHLSPPLDLVVYNIDRLSDATRLILENFNYTLKRFSIDKGEVSLWVTENLRDNTDQVISAIVSDIDGISSVAFFSGETVFTKKNIKISNNVKAWSFGTNPFIVMDDDRIIYPRGEIMSGLSLVSVSEASFTVKQGKKTETIIFSTNSKPLQRSQ